MENVWQSECVCVCACVLQWQLVFSVINDVLCDLISASEDQRLFQLDLVKVATPRRPLIIISIINPHYHRGMWDGCVISWSYTHTHIQTWVHTLRHLITYQNTMTYSLTHMSAHTHTHPSLQVDLNHNGGCRNGLSVQIKSVFLRIKRRWWWWHFRSPLQTQMPKHHSVTPSFSLTQPQIRLRTHADAHLTSALGHF